jgi:DNA-binding transcriptional MerR regulator
MEISEVAKRSGFPASRLRYYEERGLISSIGRRGLRRVYGPQIFDQLAVIALGQAAGFSLDEIANMFAPDGRPDIKRDMLEAKASELDGTIRKLSALRDGLKHAASCPEEHHTDCPTFQRLLKVAALGKRRSSAAVSKPSRKPPRPPSG